ncbi:helix-turn-helix domain-containing protein [Microbacterium sp. ARD32]|uniref:TetR/AcrR family transcriptional regulator n=1 Tax=Microbacterium sp. ARD32 TaxID=2962577 RepID=UPI002881576B|nr:helix-turn-helix domain-containing protein [Microbacterium sp. ARD32]MDT0158761.1 helix-turn-helix domain-containing protein [Microbacterium sp. ARD32]
MAEAAIELFAEHGYAETSVTDIAQRAGLAKSTFFRHFASKREVLFGEDLMSEVLTGAIAGAPAGMRPFDVVARVVDDLDDRVFTPDYRSVAVRRRAVIEAHSDLREREALKSAHLVEDVAQAFARRSDLRSDARLAARLCVFIISETYEGWAVDAGADGEAFAVIGQRVLDSVRKGVRAL